MLIGPRREKTWCSMFSNNKGSDQPAHLHSLISAFIIRLLEILLNLNLLQAKFLASLVAEEIGLSPLFSETSKTGFEGFRPILKLSKKNMLPSFTEYDMFTYRHQL